MGSARWDLLSTPVSLQDEVVVKKGRVLLADYGG
jgi:hypothetical protein